MTQPLDLNELARETAEALQTLPTGALTCEAETVILSALTKLAAVKDAEISKLQKQLHDASQVSPTEREGIECHISSMLTNDEQEEMGVDGRQLHMQVLRILSAYRDSIDDLARHKAALRIARVALTNESRNSKDKTSRDVAVTALQQIDKLLTPKP